jgi:hypothetical protein
VLGDGRDLNGKFEWQDDQGFAAIGTHDQKIRAIEPAIQLAKSVPAAFHFDTAIDTEERHPHITAESSARRAGERYPLGRETAVLKQAHDGALRSVSLFP